MQSEIRIIDCPVCKKSWMKFLVLTTDWGYENFNECLNCGIIFR